MNSKPTLRTQRNDGPMNKFNSTSLYHNVSLIITYRVVSSSISDKL